MKTHIFLAGLAVCVTASCSRAQTTGGASPGAPHVVVVPPDEMTRQPSLAPSTATPAGETLRLPMPEASAPPMAAGAGTAAGRHSYTSCNVTDQSIAMTFDDGPHPQLTPRLLDMLKARNIKATFFVIGKNVEAYPEIAKRIVEEGHEIASHTWNHPALTKLSAARVKEEVDSTRQAIEQATGVTPKLIRPPYGAINAPLTKRLAEEFGNTVILWSVDPLDWKYRNSQRVMSQILDHTKPGAIVLSHDIHATTVNAMPDTLDALQAKGFTFVTVSELLTKDRPVEMVRRDPPAVAP